AATCDDTSGILAPFITLNLAGGAGLAANYVPLNSSLAPLASYDKMGLGNNAGANALSFESEFGLPAGAGFAKFGDTVRSRLLVGIRGACDPATLANTAFIAMCTRSQDDSPNNKLDVSGMVYTAGLKGSFIPNLGSSSTATGMSHAAAVVSPPAPLVVNNFSAIQNSIGYTRSLTGANGLTRDQQSKLAKLVGNLSNAQARKLASIKTVAHVKDLVECAGIKNISLTAGSADVVSPAGNAAILARWGLAANAFQNQAGSQAVVFSSMVYNALLGQAGSVNLQIGGYDYHDGTRARGDQADEAAGVAIGRILDTARILGKKCFLYVCSDGAVVSRADANAADPNAAPWVSDRGDAGLALMFIYDPAGRPATSGFQIGSYTSGQVADAASLVGGSTEKAAQAVFANYMKFNKRMDLYQRVLSRGAFTDTELNSVLKVG
ncbi:MAG TPA: hypothetical protein PKC28_01635, partial [Bdellovibrionales bacterium]|nr:hypothetical protein [Bdellovibrionales bacterium]